MAENSLNNHSINTPSYIVDGDPGRTGGGTYTTPSTGRVDPTIQDYENIFGPAARDVKLDLQRHKRHGRWHLPDALKGSNPWIADKIDGLITDTSTSPFTTTILPYMYIENVDQKACPPPSHTHTHTVRPTLSMQADPRWRPALRSSGTGGPSTRGLALGFRTRARRGPSRRPRPRTRDTRFDRAWP